jgi:hypothetical protein
MKTLYLDLFSGISGDMFIGALIDLGLDAHRLEHELEKLPLEGYHLHATRGVKSGIAGVKFDVHLESEHTHGGHLHSHSHQHEASTVPAATGSGKGPEEHHSHGHEHEHHGHTHDHDHDHDHDGGHGRTFAQIKELISRSGLAESVKRKSLAIFQRIANAEGKIHGVPAEEVGFHEVGAVDSIVDVVGACIGLELLENPRVWSSPVTEGTGWIDCAHGRLPVPAPATLAILGARGIAVTQCEEPHELVTPTGAALLAELVERFGPMRGLVAEKTGFGFGTRNNRTRPNVLRAILGEAAGDESAHDWQTDTITVLEANLDDINAEILGHFVEQALVAGALDVFPTPIQMKKNRPGVLLTMLCAEGDADRFSELMLRETTSFGIRRYAAERKKLVREFTVAHTPYGDVKVKLGKLDGKTVQAAPEYESCKKVAETANVPLKEVYEAAVRNTQA